MKRLFVMLTVLVLTVGSASDDAADDATDDTTTTEAPADEGAPVPSAGCGASVAEPGVEIEHTINVRGADRRYLLTTPSAHDGQSPLPVVLDFHGLLEGAEIHATMSQWSALAEEEGVVAVFPHGTGDQVHWNVDISDPDRERRPRLHRRRARGARRAALHRRGARLRDRAVERSHDHLGPAVHPRRRDRGRGPGCRSDRPRAAATPPAPFRCSRITAPRTRSSCSTAG